MDYQKIISAIGGNDAGVLDLKVEANTKVGKELLEDFYYSEWEGSGMNNSLYGEGKSLIAMTCFYPDEAINYIEQVDTIFKGRRGIKKTLINIAAEKEIQF